MATVTTSTALLTAAAIMQLNTSNPTTPVVESQAARHHDLVNAIQSAPISPEATRITVNHAGTTFSVAVNKPADPEKAFLAVDRQAFQQAYAAAAFSADLDANQIIPEGNNFQIRRLFDISTLAATLKDADPLKDAKTIEDGKPKVEEEIVVAKCLAINGVKISEAGLRDPNQLYRELTRDLEISVLQYGRDKDLDVPDAFNVKFNNPTSLEDTIAIMMCIAKRMDEEHFGAPTVSTSFNGVQIKLSAGMTYAAVLANLRDELYPREKSLRLSDLSEAPVDLKSSLF